MAKPLAELKPLKVQRSSNRPSRDANSIREKKRDELWDDAEKQVYNPSKRETVGYARIPRVLPLVAALIDGLNTKNAGGLYIALWARDFGQGFVEANDPEGIAYEAGYMQSAARAHRCWTERIAILVEHGFVRTKRNGPREHGFVLLRDPHLAVLELHSKTPDVFPAGWMDTFRSRCIEVGVKLHKYMKE